MRIDDNGPAYKPPKAKTSKPKPRTTPNPLTTMLAAVLGPPKQPVPRPAPKPVAPKAVPKPVAKPQTNNQALDFLTKSLVSKTPPKPTNNNPLNVIAKSVPAKPAPKPVANPAAKAPVVAGSSSFKPLPVVPSSVGSSSVSTKISVPTVKPGSTQSIANAVQGFMDKAKASVTAEDLPYLNELQRQLDAVNATADRTKGDITERSKLTELGLGAIYDRLTKFTEGVKTANDTNYANLTQQQGQNYDSLVQSLSGNYADAAKSSADELSRLGIAGTASGAAGNMQRDQAFLTNLAGVDKTNALASLGSSKNAFDSLMDMNAQSAGAEGAMLQGQNKLQTDKALSDLAFQLGLDVKDLTGKRGDRIATQGQRTRELAEALEGKDYARRADESDREFSRRMATAELSLKQQDQAIQNAALNAPASYSDQLDVALKEARLGQMLNPTAGKAPKLTPEQRAKQILHAALENPKNPDSNRNMTDLWNIIDTLRGGRYDDVDHNLNDSAPHAGKFDVNDPALLKHLDMALRSRDLSGSKSTALDIIRALTGKL